VSESIGKREQFGLAASRCSAVGASCLTALFWLALKMFRVVLWAQRAIRTK
jgi:hypothetical protein